MANYVDNKLVNIHDKDNVYAKEYKAALVGLEKMEFPLVFRSIYKKGKTHGNNLPTVLQLTAPEERKEEGTVIWRYTTALPSFDKNNNPKFKESSMICNNGEIRVNKNQLDLAFFIIHKSRQYKRGEWYLVDEKKDANEKAISKQLKVDVDALIWGSSSVLTGNYLKQIARYYQVTGIAKKSDNQIKLDLDGKIDSLAKKNQKIYAEFVEKVQTLSGIDTKANIFRAIEEGVVIINYDQHFASLKNDSPFYRFDTNEFGNEIDALAEFCENEGSGIYDTICNSLGIASNNFLDLKFSNQTAYRKAVYDYAKTNGIKSKPRKFEDVEADVVAHKKATDAGNGDDSD